MRKKTENYETRACSKPWKRDEKKRLGKTKTIS